MSTKQQIFDIVNERTNGPICYLNDTLDEHAGRILEALENTDTERVEAIKDELRDAEHDLKEKIKTLDELVDALKAMRKAGTITEDACYTLTAILEG